MFLRGVIVTFLFSAAAIAASHKPVCPGPAAPGTGRCHARVVTDPNGNPKATALPSGYGTTDFKTAYGLTSSGTAVTVAIVDAYDDPNIESDLAVYSSTYGLPSCTTANGCFKKVNQTGGTNYPTKNAGWSLEIALDV